jgi:hypothetical protein
MHKPMRVGAEHASQRNAVLESSSRENGQSKIRVASIPRKGAVIAGYASARFDIRSMAIQQLRCWRTLTSIDLQPGWLHRERSLPRFRVVRWTALPFLQTHAYF